MFNINSISNTNPRNSEYIINDYLTLLRSQNSTLNNVVNSLSNSNQNVINVMNEYFDLRRRIIDLSNNTIRTTPRTYRSRPRHSPPPPPPTANPPSFRYNPRRSRRATFYTPLFTSTATSASNTPNNTINSFINNTLWNSSTISTPANINTILASSSIHVWSDIKSDHVTTERCPIDLSILNDNDIVI